MPPMRPAVRRTLDLGVIGVLTAFVTTVSQPWTGFNSPDSEFYATLALFGSEVTDRAIEPAYTWTRLGYIVPVRVVVTTFGTWVGFEVWRITLLSLIIGSVYAVGIVAGRSRVLGACLALFVALNSVVLAFVGNTYLTGTAIAAMFALLATAISYLGNSGAHGRGVLGTPRWTTGVLSGLLLGWLIMINPYAAILGGSMWVTVRLVVLVKLHDERWRRLLVDGASAGVGLGIALLGFLAAGRQVFPRMNWWSTYLEWNSRLDYSVFIIDGSTWQRDSALLVVVASVIVSVASVAFFPTRRWVWAGAAIALANLAVTAALMVVFTGPWLEAPTYVAKLWPGALLGLALTFLAMSPGTRDPRASYRAIIVSVAAVTIPLLLWSGRFDDVLPRGLAWLLVTVIILTTLAAMLVVRLRWNIGVALIVSIAMLVAFVGAQVLQNGRGLLGGYGQYPFRSAFVDFEYRDQMEAKVAVQRWLVSKTSRDDTVALWTDPQSLTADVAAMQLWGGYNIFTLDGTLNRDSTARLEQIRPSVIALYAPDRKQIADLYDTLPPWSLPTELECVSEPYLGIGTGEVIACITRLTWVG